MSSAGSTEPATPIGLMKRASGRAWRAKQVLAVKTTVVQPAWGPSVGGDDQCHQYETSAKQSQT